MQQEQIIHQQSSRRRRMLGYVLSVWAVAAVGGYLPYVGKRECW